MLGISVYFKDLDYDYISYASKVGFKYIFTSLHIPEEDLSKLEDELPSFLKFVNDNNLILIPDISPKTFEKLKIENNDYKSLKKMGFKYLRLDYGFDDFKVVKNLQKHFYLILNASVIDEKYILEAIENDIDISKIKVLHNFYPKTNTAISSKSFDDKNRVFKKYNLDVMAFVVGDKLKRFPLYEGLCTLESHRQLNPYVASVELIKKYGVDDVLIGDSKANYNTLDYISEYVKNNIITLPCILNSDLDIDGKIYDIRKDIPEKVIRLVSDRISDIKPLNNNYRFIGSITQSNLLAQRYSGEIQICKEEMSQDSRENILGVIHPEYIKILDYIDDNVKIKFVDIKKAY